MKATLAVTKDMAYLIHKPGETKKLPRDIIKDILVYTMKDMYEIHIRRLYRQINAVYFELDTTPKYNIKTKKYESRGDGYVRVAFEDNKEVELPMTQHMFSMALEFINGVNCVMSVNE
jgi:hypothetical protein